MVCSCLLSSVSGCCRLRLSCSDALDAHLSSAWSAIRTDAAARATQLRMERTAHARICERFSKRIKVYFYCFQYFFVYKKYTQILVVSKQKICARNYNLLYICLCYYHEKHFHNYIIYICNKCVQKSSGKNNVLNCQSHALLWQRDQRVAASPLV